MTLIYGVGFSGKGKYRPSQNNKPTRAYSVWNQMFRRVYKPQNDYQIRCYKDVSIDPNWEDFQVFAAWYYQQIECHGEVEFQWHMDKDLLIPGNRIYGPNTCVVIPSAVNILFADCFHARGNLPLGVTRNGPGYQAQCGKKNKGSRYLGTYKTIAEAQNAYWCAKFQAIHSAALQYWKYLPEPIAMRLCAFDWNDAVAYYGDDAKIIK